MDFLKAINEVLQYIEDNLEGKIDYDEAVKCTGYSLGYFGRVFSCIAGVSLSEYVRRRKMTKAAMELSDSSIRIIDLAVKYGYESADSFTRAFQSVHGINPSAARHKGAAVKSFSPIRCHISVEGAEAINYRIEKRDSMRVVGIMKHYKAPENNPGDVSVFWNELFASGRYDDIAVLSDKEPKGVHGFLNVIDDKRVDYMIGAVTDKDVPEGMEEIIVPGGEYAIFETKGILESSIASLWRRIYDEWFPSLNYKHAETIEIECFRYDGDRTSDNFHFEIWVPVVKI